MIKSLLLFFCLSTLCAAKPNVLFIAIDDLRTDLGCYGAEHIISPNIDKLAANGVRFDRAYCQQAICGPSRASVMTGLRPDSVGVHGNYTDFRSLHPDIVTLPRHFMNNGYHAQSMGKIYHCVFPPGSSKSEADTFGDEFSWSVPTFRPGPRYYYTEEGIAAAKETFSKTYGKGDWTQTLVFGPATEAPDVDDSVLYDGQIADHAVKTLREMQKDKPFFLAVGFTKPHSPYIAPKKYWDLYDPEKIAPADNQTPPALKLAGHDSGELRRYTDQQKRGDIPGADQRKVRHAYYACISYIDAQVGKVLDELDAQGLADNTIVVLWADHGYHLGEKGLWGKATNFELDARVPLIVRAPGKKSNGQSSSALVELVDLYPTLADLAGFPGDERLEGTSFVPLLDDPDKRWKKAAFTQFTRGGHRGYSIATETDRYVEWFEISTSTLVARELYFHTGDPGEMTNVAEQQPEAARHFSRLLDRGEGWRHALPNPGFTVAAIFGDNMVLQRGEPLGIRGTATPGSNVKVTFSGEEFDCSAGLDGLWGTLSFGDSLEASNEGRVLTVICGEEKIEFKNVVVGDVWICAGQSNMRWMVKQSAEGKEAISKSTNSDLRLIDYTGRVYPDRTRYTTENLRAGSIAGYYKTGDWQVASPDSIPTFSAVAYYFGAMLQRELGVPVGLIHSAIGGVPMESYIPVEALESDPLLNPLLKDWTNNPGIPEWVRQRAKENLAAWEESPRGLRPHHPFEPGFLFEAGMRKLASFGIAGFLWYQGESNATENGANSVAIDRSINQHKFETLIKSWREAWGGERIPFLFAQLPRLDNRDWKSFREMQADVAEKVPGVGMADIYEFGDPGNVHPLRKKPVGEKLARLALNGIPAKPFICDFEDVPEHDFIFTDQYENFYWSADTGHAEVTGKFAHKGTRSLHIKGGEERQIEMSARWLVTAATLSFQAERWTMREPFSFRIETTKDGEKWNEIYNGDREIKVGARFLSNVRVPIDEGIQKFRFICTSPEGGGILIDHVRIDPVKEMEIVGLTQSSPVSPVLIGKKNNTVLKVRCDTAGGLKSKVVNALEISLPTKDVKNVSVQVNGEPFGKETTPGEKITFEGALLLKEGENLITVSCELVGGASIDRHISASCTRIKIGDAVLTPEDGGLKPQRIGVALRQRGQDDSDAYRIPGLATTNKGTLIAVYDNRYRGGGDLPGDIDVGMSRSVDGGQSWAAMKVIMDMGNDPKFSYDGIGDPAVLVDRKTNTIWVAATWSHGNRSWNGSGPGLESAETGQFMLVRSDDDGVTWSKPINITKQIKDPKWRFVLQGPGKGITMRDGTLVFSAQYRDADGVPFSTMIHSTDRGETWTIGTGVKSKTTESQLVELGDGSIMINCRDDRGGSRSVYTTRDLGKTWIEHPTTRSALPEPVCMASLIRVENENYGPLLFFSNPNQTRGRARMTIKVSNDEGLTWPEKWHALIDEETSMYSCMTLVGEDKIGLFYEGPGEIYFVRVPIDELMKIEKFRQ
jgi:sialidase-1